MRRLHCAVRLCLGVIAALLSMSPDASAHPVVDERIAEANRRIAEHPDDAALYVARAESHRAAGHLDHARSDLTHARSLDPSYAGLDVVSGALELDAGNPAQAIEYLDRHLASNTEDCRAHVFRARGHAQLGQHMAAIADYDAALSNLAGPRPEHYLERFDAHRAVGDDARALSGLKEARTRLGFVIAIEQAGLALELERHAYDAALARVDAMQPAFNGGAIWWEWRADVLRAAGREMEALASYSEALSAIEAMPEARRSRSNVRAMETRLRTALTTKENTP